MTGLAPLLDVRLREGNVRNRRVMRCRGHVAGPGHGEFSPCWPARGDRIIRFSPSDFEIVVFWIAKIGGAAREELGIDGLFGNPSAGVTHLLGQLIDLIGRINHNSDGEANARAADIWFDLPVVGKFTDGKQRNDNTSQVECREVIVVDDHGPTQFTVELPKSREITCAQRDHHISKEIGCAHSVSIRRAFGQPRSASRDCVATGVQPPTWVVRRP